MNSSYISKNGEVTSKEALIAEIEALLNAIPASSHTQLSIEVMSALSCADLEQVRDNLLLKQGNVIENNASWLLGLCDD